MGGRRPIVWGDYLHMEKIIIKYIMALGGRHLAATHNNQLGIGGRSGSDVGEEARAD